jgi:hypothetical protein
MNFARIKLVAAAVLLACLALPEYTCSRFVGPDGQVVAAGPAGVPTTPYREVQEKHYPLESFSAREIGSWVTLLAFVWPWPVLAYYRRIRRGRGAQGAVQRVVWIGEPLLSIGSGYVIWTVSGLGTRAAGAYLSLAANAVYLAAWVAELRKNR